MKYYPLILRGLTDDLIILGVKELSIGCGEPFLRDVCRILDYTSGKLDLSVTTNGTSECIQN
jgi:MoaA/NifB/PqqE/SkfB family radical SAM enzyme